MSRKKFALQPGQQQFICRDAHTSTMKSYMPPLLVKLFQALQASYNVAESGIKQSIPSELEILAGKFGQWQDCMKALTERAALFTADIAAHDPVGYAVRREKLQENLCKMTVPGLRKLFEDTTIFRVPPSDLSKQEVLLPSERSTMSQDVLKKFDEERGKRWTSDRH